MSECRRTVEQLTPFVDGVLPPGERADVERHLGLCPPCRRAAAEAEGGRTVLRARAGDLRDARLGEGLRETLGETLPPGLRTRCEALAREHSATPVSSWARRFVPTFAIALVLITTAAALFALATGASDVLLAQQLTLDHAKCFRLFASSPAAGIDAQKAEEALEQRFRWDVHVPRSSESEGVTLVGARRCLYASGSMPHLMYRANGQKMSLFLLDGVTRRSADVVTLGHHSRIWSDGAITYVLVSPRDSSEFDRAAQYMMRQAH